MRSRSGVGAKLKGLRRVRQDGKRYVYHRATGMRMPDLPEHHPEFLRAYLDAEKQAESGSKPAGVRHAKPGTLLAVWHAYATSDRFRAHSPAYQRLMQRQGDKIMQTGRDVPIRQIRAEHIRKDMEGMKPNAKNVRLKAWRALMGHAVEIGMIANDPSRQVQRARAPVQQSHQRWTASDIGKFRTHWPLGTPQRLAFELLQWTGARISDMVRMGEGMVDPEGWLCFRQAKTGGEVAIPLHREPPPFADPEDLRQLLAALSARPERHMTYLTTHYGAARSVKSASQWFSAAARSAQLPAKRTAHGLRVTRAIKLAEAGATTHQIGAWTGHESLSEIDHYSRAAGRKNLLTAHEAGTKIVQKIQS